MDSTMVARTLVGPQEAAHDRTSGRRRWGLGALVAQLFLVSVYVGIATSDLDIWVKLGSLALLAAFSTVYVLLVGRSMDTPLRTRILVTGGLLALTLPQFLVMGTSATVLWIFVAVAGGLLFPDIVAISFGLLLAAVMLLINALAGEPLSWELALTLVALTAFMVGFAGNIRLTIELRATREQLAQAAVAAERERIGRDLHDILGHSLTAITVKAGLARRLLGSDIAAATTEISDVERLAREALADVRATASGFRQVTLAAELAVAKTVLQAAGIRAVLPQAVDDVDPAYRELFGYVVRESVTNVVRHSGADSCTITVSRQGIDVTDDGARRSSDAGFGGSAEQDGAGLRGLAARVETRGGTFEAGPRPGGGFGVRVVMPVLHPAPIAR